MIKVTSTKLRNQKFNKATKMMEKILEAAKNKNPVVNKKMLVDANCTIPASQLGASKNLAEAKAYLAEQASKANCKKLAEEKANNFVK